MKEAIVALSVAFFLISFPTTSPQEKDMCYQFLVKQLKQGVTDCGMGMKLCGNFRNDKRMRKGCLETCTDYLNATMSSDYTVATIPTLHGRTCTRLTNFLCIRIVAAVQDH